MRYLLSLLALAFLYFFKASALGRVIEAVFK